MISVDIIWFPPGFVMCELAKRAQQWSLEPSGWPAEVLTVHLWAIQKLSGGRAMQQRM
eukprot:SAG22_NODE_7907_length_698_cov_2.459098_1_plen_57_part_10